MVHRRSRIGLLPPLKVGISGAEGFVSSEGSAAGVVSFGLGVKVTVEVIATGGVGVKVEETLGIALPQGGHGFGAGIALLARKVDKRCESAESDSSESSYSKIGGGAGSVPRCVELWGIVDREAGASSDLDFFFGCGFSIVRLFCLDRTGTGIVGLDGGVGTVDIGRGSGCGSMRGSVWMGNMGEARVVGESPGGWQW